MQTIREYAREVLLDAKLKIIKKYMEPIDPCPENPLPSNRFHLWHEEIKNEKDYDELVDQRFMGIIADIEKGYNQETLEDIH